jgi:hypothetical protein
VRLNRKQSVVVYVALALILSMLVFPPFVMSIRGSVLDEGYQFIGTGDGEVAASRVVFQCFAVLVVAAGVVFALRDRS